MAILNLTIYVCDWCCEKPEPLKANAGYPEGWDLICVDDTEILLCGVCIKRRSDKLAEAEAERRQQI